MVWISQSFFIISVWHENWQIILKGENILFSREFLEWPWEVICLNESIFITLEWPWNMGVWFAFAIAIRRILGFYTLGTHFHRDIKAILNVWAFASKVSPWTFLVVEGRWKTWVVSKCHLPLSFQTNFEHQMQKFQRLNENVLEIVDWLVNSNRAQ